MVGCTNKQSLHLYLKRSDPHDHQMGKQSNIDKKTGKCQRQKLIHILGKGRHPFPLGKILIQKDHIPQKHHSISHSHCNQKSFHMGIPSISNTQPDINVITIAAVNDSMIPL